MDGIDLTLNNAALWALFLGMVLPLAIAFIQQPQWSDQVRSIVTPVICLAVAAVTVWVQGAFDLKDWFRTAMIVFLVAQVTYRTYWKPSGITKRVEEGTSPRA